MILFASTNLIYKYEVLGNVFFFFLETKSFSPLLLVVGETGGRWLGTHKLKQGW